MVSRRTGHRYARLLLLPAASIAAAIALFGCTSGSTAVAQPAPMDFCTQALDDVLAGIPWAGIPDGLDLNRLDPNGGGTSININSGNNISVQSGPNNVNVQSTTVGDNTSTNANNSFSCCVNGRCCVSSGSGTAACTP